MKWASYSECPKAFFYRMFYYKQHCLSLKRQSQSACYCKSLNCPASQWRFVPIFLQYHRYQQKQPFLLMTLMRFWKNWTCQSLAFFVWIRICFHKRHSYWQHRTIRDSIDCRRQIFVFFLSKTRFLAFLHSTFERLRILNLFWPRQILSAHTSSSQLLIQVTTKRKNVYKVQ